ncbi:MAG: hypothetical protein F4Z04_00895 [Acidobacteria bacterium]|nr:hypothetical protein [Acidobacteriota bacterium]
MRTEPSDPDGTADARRLGRALLIAGLVGLAGLAAVLAWWATADDPPAPPATRRALSILVPDDVELLDIAVSRDGRQLAYTAIRDGRARLYVRPIDSFEAVELPDTAGAEQPFFSPDGSAIAFLAGPQLKRSAVPASPDQPPPGPVPALLAEFTGLPVGGHWRHDGTIVIGGPGATGLLAVPPDGGTPAPITTVDTASGETAHGWPQRFDDDHLLFTIGRDGRDPRVALLHVGTGRMLPLLLADGGGFAVEPNTIVVARRGEIFAAEVDRDLLDNLDDPSAPPRDRPSDIAIALGAPADAGMDGAALALSPRPVLRGVASSGIGYHGLGRARFAAARDGTLVFVPPAVTAGANRLVLVDRDGSAEPIDNVVAQHQTPRVSPDGQRIAFGTTTTILQRDLWLLDLAGGSRRRLTEDAGDNHSPLWSRDGGSITFASSRAGLQQVFRLGLPQFETSGPILAGDLRTPGSWSPDGRRLAFHEPHPDRHRDIWTWRDGSDDEPEPWLATPANERAPAYSPGGQWIAYVSDGAHGDQVYVRAATAGASATAVRVSPAGGTEPVWARTGDALFFRRGRSLYEAPIGDGDARPAVGEPALVLEGTFLADALGNLPAYDITSQRQFVMMELASRPSVVHIVSGWRQAVFPPPPD